MSTREEFPDNVLPLPAAAPQERLTYRPMEIVKLTGLSVGFVYEAMYRGDLASYQIGKARVIYVDEVHRWIKSGGKAAGAESTS